MSETTNRTIDFAPAIARCLRPNADQATLKTVAGLVRDVLSQPSQLSRGDLQQIQDTIDATLGDDDSVALVYGGATKIKGYVFEAPKLPEIRGASALLDWVNEVELPKLWGADKPEDFVEKGIIYSSGGNILAFAPATKGQELATAVEHCYTENTLNANSVAVCETFSLLELRYGRRPLEYWVENFAKDWPDEHKRRLLEQYYYPPEGVQPEDSSAEALRARFYNRKTFGELVTVLATKFNRRRDERAYAGEPRSVPFYPMIPWAEKCDSSDIRPAVWSGTVADEQRKMSEASTRKRYVGQKVKKEGESATRWFKETFKNWAAPESLESWERQWETYVEQNSDTHFAQAAINNPEKIRPIDLKPPQDIGEISQASSPSRYIGIIYADGNNVGRLIATLQTPHAYSQTSEILRHAATDAVFRALSKHLEPYKARSDKGRMRWIHPFEILAIGGDDLFLIVPGDKAFDIALTIGLTFEKMLAEKLQDYVHDTALSSAAFQGRYNADSKAIADDYRPSIGLSAGVIIAQENAPIFFLRDLVEELLKSAKKLARQNVQQGYYGGLLISW